jgi:hypothetical protein
MERRSEVLSYNIHVDGINRLLLSIMHGYGTQLYVQSLIYYF